VRITSVLVELNNVGVSLAVDFFHNFQVEILLEKRFGQFVTGEQLGIPEFCDCGIGWVGVVKNAHARRSHFVVQEQERSCWAQSRSLSGVFQEFFHEMVVIRIIYVI
jgi:hypothetical protein